MSVVIWSSFQSVTDPVYVLVTLLFLVGLLPIALRSASPSSAAEFGALYGFVFGVAVWGSLGYYYNLSAYQKLYHGFGVTADAVWLCALINSLVARSRRRSAA